MSDENNGGNSGKDQHIIPMGNLGLKKRVDELEKRVSELEKANEHHAAVNVMMAEKYAALRDLVMRAVESVNRAAARLESKNKD